jgi:hypothetical protein
MDAARELLERFPDPDEAEIPFVCRALYLYSGSSDTASGPDALSPELHRAMELAEAIGDGDLLAAALHVRATQMLMLDRPMEAALSWQGTISLTRDPWFVHIGHLGLGELALFADDPRAETHFEQALRMAQELGDRSSAESIAGYDLALLDLSRGHWEAAEERARRGRAALVEYGYSEMSQAMLHVAVGIICRFRGDDPGLAEALHASAAAMQSEDPAPAGMHTWLQLEHRALGGEDVAAALAEAAEASATQGTRREWFRFIWVDALGEARRAGRNDLVDRLLPIIADRPQGGVPPFLRAQRMRYQGLRAADEGDLAGGDDLLRHAVETLDGLGYPYWTACAKLDRASVLEARGEAEAAHHLREEGLAVLRDLGAGHVLAAGADVLDRERVGIAAGGGRP